MTPGSTGGKCGGECVLRVETLKQERTPLVRTPASTVNRVDSGAFIACLGESGIRWRKNYTNKAIAV